MPILRRDAAASYSTELRGLVISKMYGSVGATEAAIQDFTGSLIYNESDVLDFFVVSMLGSSGYARKGFKVALGMGDLLTYINSGSIERWMSFCNQFFIASSPGKIREAAVPDGVGLVEVHVNEPTPELMCQIIVDPPIRRSLRLTDEFVAAVAKYALREEKRAALMEARNKLEMPGKPAPKKLTFLKSANGAPKNEVPRSIFKKGPASRP